MAAHKTIAITIAGLTGEIGKVVDAMLDGVRSAGCEAEHFLLCRPGDCPQDAASTFDGVAQDKAAMRNVLERASGAEHLILGLTGRSGQGNRAFHELRDACYEGAKWISLGDVVGNDSEAKTPPEADLQAVAFPAPRRALTDAHRALAVYEPPDEVLDHDDPFCESAFFLVEELQRLLGFLPVGRVLSTGLFCPPLDENPVLKQQTFELGKRLVTGAISIGGRSIGGRSIGGTSVGGASVGGGK